MAMKVVLVDCLIYQGLLRYQRRRAAGSPDRDEPITFRMKRAQTLTGLHALQLHCDCIVRCTLLA